MVHVKAVLTFQEDAQQSVGIGFGGRQFHGIFLPVVARHVQAFLGYHFVVRTHQFHADSGLSLRACIDAELVAHTFLQAHAEVTAVFNARPLVGMAVVLQAYIMRIAREGRVVVLYLHVAEGLPGHQSLRKLKRTVLHHVGIEASVGSEVDVFEEYAVHRRLNHSPGFVGLDGVLVTTVGSHCMTGGCQGTHQQNTK